MAMFRTNKGSGIDTWAKKKGGPGSRKKVLTQKGIRKLLKKRTWKGHDTQR